MNTKEILVFTGKDNELYNDELQASLSEKFVGWKISVFPEEMTPSTQSTEPLAPYEENFIPTEMLRVWASGKWNKQYIKRFLYWVKNLYANQ